MNRLMRGGTAENPSRETKFSGANGDTGKFSLFRLTTSRIGNLTRSILTLAIRDDHTYIYTHGVTDPFGSLCGVIGCAFFLKKRNS